MLIIDSVIACGICLISIMGTIYLIADMVRNHKEYKKLEEIEHKLEIERIINDLKERN